MLKYTPENAGALEALKQAKTSVDGALSGYGYVEPAQPAEPTQYTGDDMASGASNIDAIASGQASVSISQPDDTQLKAALEKTTLDNPTVFPRSMLTDGTIFNHNITLEDIAAGKITLV